MCLSGRNTVGTDNKKLVRTPFLYTDSKQLDCSQISLRQNYFSSFSLQEPLVAWRAENIPGPVADIILLARLDWKNFSDDRLVS